ncbi:AGR045Wp [Eremothecium gossypii ATCC 10895]|uniref:AGR045Wp n=1 Tax=Eremothecium gossypii (strain ATCC 10895 / CBS 109.51 / FGSC 9923 / NRRL Y-1056) TaxID=284811 RepID=Q750B2_EREGS|nr:AGR045Wp [Eremothecium gossypii ATCC 10895]AAS54534.1 AGR045Wp [Eremothecium gossypii ATCC 10895]AEY98866.1 FAGR045Wp [Eremothecium gossypii FDAG1]
MDYQEEQKQELEVLESIYADDLTVVCGEYPKIQFEVDLKLDLIPLASSSFTAAAISKEQHLVVDITLPERYPEEAPQLSIRPWDVRGGDEAGEEDEEQEYDEHGNPVVAKLENIPDSISFDGEVDGFASQAMRQVEEDMLLGIQMCFALISSIKEDAESWFQKELERREKEHERQLRERELEEQKKFRGTKVTHESYMSWRASFRQELGLDERDQERRMQAHLGRLSGRQIFEEGLAGEEDVEAGEDDIVQGIKQL